MSIRQSRKSKRANPLSRKMRRAKKRLDARISEYERNMGNKTSSPFTKPGSMQYH